MCTLEGAATTTLIERGGKDYWQEWQVWQANPCKVQEIFVRYDVLEPTVRSNSCPKAFPA